MGEADCGMADMGDGVGDGSDDMGAAGSGCAAAPRPTPQAMAFLALLGMVRRRAQPKVAKASAKGA